MLDRGAKVENKGENDELKVHSSENPMAMEFYVPPIYVPIF